MASLNRVILECIDRAEPLLSCTEDDRVLAAPAMRIAMNDILDCEQCIACTQIIQNDRGGLLIIHTSILASIFSCISLAINRNDDRNIILLADNKVVCTEARCGMNTAGTSIQRNVLAGNDYRLTIHDRMLGLHHFQVRAQQSRQNFPRLNASSLHDTVD